MLARSGAERADYPVVLDPGSGRITHYAPCGRFVQTDAARMMTKCAARTDPASALLGAPEIAPAGLRLPRRWVSGVRSSGARTPILGPDAAHQCPGCQGLRGPHAARLWGAEEHRACGQRAARSSTCSSPLSERRERSERSEFGDAAARPSTARQSARSAHDRPSEALHGVPAGLGSPPANTPRAQSANNMRRETPTQPVASGRRQSVSLPLNRAGRASSSSRANPGPGRP